MHHRILSENKRAQCVSDRVTYIVMRGRWCNIIFLNVHERNEEKSDYLKDIYKELEKVIVIFPRTIWEFC